jgi:hypothetical protein
MMTAHQSQFGIKAAYFYMDIPNLGADMLVFSAPIGAADKCPFLVGCNRWRRMPPTLAASRVFAQMFIRLTVR